MIGHTFTHTPVTVPVIVTLLRVAFVYVPPVIVVVPAFVIVVLVFVIDHPVLVCVVFVVFIVPPV